MSNHSSELITKYLIKIHTHYNKNLKRYRTVTDRSYVLGTTGSETGSVAESGAGGQDLL